MELRIQHLLILAVIALVLVYGVLSFRDVQETRDAETVEAVQVALQAEVSKGITALQKAPTEIQPKNFINAARTAFPKGVRMDSSYKMSIEPSGRGARFEITKDGDVNLVSLESFTRFRVENGRIIRNNRWGLAMPQNMIPFETAIR